MEKSSLRNKPPKKKITQKINNNKKLSTESVKVQKYEVKSRIFFKNFIFDPFDAFYRTENLRGFNRSSFSSLR